MSIIVIVKVGFGKCYMFSVLINAFCIVTRPIGTGFLAVARILLFATAL
jgi:hypothetical protein